LFTKYEATIAGLIFSAVFFTIFTISERHVTKERHGKPEQLDQFRVYGNQELGSGAMGVRPGNVLVCCPRPTQSVFICETWLSRTNTAKQDVVVMRRVRITASTSFSGSAVMEAASIRPL